MALVKMLFSDKHSSLLRRIIKNKKVMKLATVKLLQEPEAAVSSPPKSAEN
jgi:hypothetical protein